MSTFHERKQERTEFYNKYVKGWKLRACTACNGSGYYDHNGSPYCGACYGTGKERYNPVREEEMVIEFALELGFERWQIPFWKEYRVSKRGRAFLETETGKNIDKQYLDLLEAVNVN